MPPSSPAVVSWKNRTEQQPATAREGASETELHLQTGVTLSIAFYGVRYVSLADTSGQEVDTAVSGCMLSTAVTLKSDEPGKTSVRLIDNVML